MDFSNTLSHKLSYKHYWLRKALVDGFLIYNWEKGAAILGSPFCLFLFIFGLYLLYICLFFKVSSSISNRIPGIRKREAGRRKGC